MQGPGSLAMDKEDINQGGGDVPCPIVFGELQLGVRRRRKEEGEEEESQVAEEEEKEEREVGKGSQGEEERRSSNNSTSGTKNYSVEKSLSDALVGSANAVSKVECGGGGGGERRRRGSKSSLFQRLRSLQEGRSLQGRENVECRRNDDEEVERRRRRRRRGNDAEDGGDLEGKSHRRSLVLRGGDGEQTSNVSRQGSRSCPSSPSLSSRRKSKGWLQRNIFKTSR